MFFNPRNLLLSAAIFLSAVSAAPAGASCAANKSGHNPKSDFLTALNAYRTSKDPGLTILTMNKALEDATVQMAHLMVKDNEIHSPPNSINQDIHNADPSVSQEYWLNGGGFTSYADFLSMLEDYPDVLLGSVFNITGFSQEGEFFAFVLAVGA